MDDTNYFKQTSGWTISQRADSTLPGYLIVAAKRKTSELWSLPAEELTELGSLLGVAQRALMETLGAKRVYIGRYGHTAGHSFHFHIIPIYDWIEDMFASDERYRLLQSFADPDFGTEPDGAELTLYVWREFCESRHPPQVRGPTVSEAIALLRERLM
ncbi:HIT family protein [Oryzifoliimicrobium ureilyticus]|uniref:HIT family protein n=1 Tax=Oryzifoliimicrobium ureilyticus TaxID=3113724 RepID=UPI0030762E53